MPRLSLALLCALGLAACSGDDAASTSDTDGATTTTTDDTTGTTDAETTTTSTSTTGTASDSMTGTTTTTSTTDATTTTTTSTTDATTTTGDTDTDTGGVMHEPLCVDMCDHAAECAGAEVPMCLSECDEYTGILHAVGPVCAAAIDEVLICAAGLECVELAAFFNDQPNPCSDKIAKVDGDPPMCVLEEEPPGFCTDFCEHAEMCQLAEPGCLPDCTATAGFGGAQSPECGAAIEALYACFTGLDCDNLQNPVTCLDEQTAADAVCNF